VTIVATGRLVHLALEMAHAANFDAEIIDLQRMAPLDISVILESLEKTSRLVIAHDEPRTGGLSAQIESLVQEQGFWFLSGPISRVNSPPTPIPAAASLEDAYMVTGEAIRDACEASMQNSR
jgi:pyruvate dehydrogenase E1 component beta subunit